MNMSTLKTKKMFVGVVTTIVALASFASSAGASYFTDYSATGSGAEATAQFNAAGGKVIQVGGSISYTWLQVVIKFIEANAIGLIIITLLLGLIGILAYRKRLKKAQAKL